MAFNFNIGILLIIVVTFLTTGAWVEVVEKSFFDYFQLDRNSKRSWFILALASTILLLVVVNFLRLEIHELLGVSELVDMILTRTKESLRKGGKVVHSLLK